MVSSRVNPLSRDDRRHRRSPAATNIPFPCSRPRPLYYVPGLSQHLPVQPLPIDLNGIVCGRPLPGGSFPQRSAVRRVAVGVVQRGRRAGAAETVVRLCFERVGADLSLYRR